MDLIERYVSAVGAKLQPARRIKVEAELRAAILDALEARGSTVADEEDVVAVLAELGDPERIAAEYEPARQYLIGPALYPHFRRGLRVSMATIVAVSALAFGISLLLGGLAGYKAGGLLVQTLWYAGAAAVAVVAVLIAVFTWMQRAEVSLPRRALTDAPWDPRALPSRPEADRTGRFDAVVGLVAAAAALVVVGLIGQVAREAGPHASPQIQSLIRDAVSRNVMFLQLALVVAAVAHAVALVQGRWSSWTYGMRLVADATALVVFVPLPFRLMSARAALLESGMTPNVVNWLIANAFVFAAVLAGLMIHSWWRTARRVSRTGASTFSTGAAIASLGALLVPLSGCAIGTWQTTIVTVTESADTAVGHAPVKSPEIDQDGHITYRYFAPEARQVVLVAEGMEPSPMTRDLNGVWSYTSGPMVPDLYLYFFVVDGEPKHDPANAAEVPRADGGRRNLAHVPARKAVPWESSGAAAGNMQRVAYRSVRFDDSRDVWVYTPPGYDATQGRRYPVLYLLHGASDDARAWGTAGRVNVILDNMLAAGAVEPMIVVMPLGYGFPNAASRAGEMLSPRIDQLAVSRELCAGLIEEVLPLIEREYRVQPGRESRAIAGLSMGGSQALHIGLTHREKFAHVASFGGALIMYGGRYDEWFPHLALARPNMPQSLHLSVGSEDLLLGVNRHFAGWLNANDTAANLDEVPGGHTWQVWRRELIRLVPQLFNTPVAAQDTLPSAEQLTARHVEAIGGRDAVLRPQTTRSTGTFEMAAAGLKGNLTIVTEAPNRTVSRITVPDMDDMLSGYDGEFGWSMEPMAGPRLLSGGELNVMRENSHVLAAVRDPSLFASMQTIERTESAGQPCYRVRLVWQSGRESHDCYHAETSLLIESKEEVESPIGMIQVTTTLSDYREFGGIMYPTRTVLSMMGAEQVLTILRVEFDNIDTSLLELPAEIRRLVTKR